MPLLILLAFLLSACALNTDVIARDLGVAQAAEGNAPLVIPNATPTPFSFPTEIPSPTVVDPRASPTRPFQPIAEALFTPVPTARPCTEKRGTVITASLASNVLNYPLDAQIYLPPCYGHTVTQRYPVLYLIHGLGFTNTQWARLGMPAQADALIAAQEIAPLIIVMPSDRRDDRLDPALTEDLIPYIDKTYRTLTDRRFRAIGGLSRGGGWSIHFGLHYPELFGRVGGHSPAIFIGDEQNLLDWVRKLTPETAPLFYFDVGDDDANPQSAYWLDQVFTWAGMDHFYVTQPGNHSEKYWATHAPDYLRFYAADWRADLTPPAP